MSSVPAAPPAKVEWPERIRVLLLLMAFAGLCHFNRVSISVVGTEYLIREDGLSKEQMGWIYFSYLLLYTILMTPAGWLIDRFGPRRTLAGMEFGSAALVMMSALPAILLGKPGLVFPAFLLIRAGLGSFTAPMHPGAARAVSLWLPRSGWSLGNGLVTGSAVLGIAATAPLFGWMSSDLAWPSRETGWVGAFLIAGGVTFLVANLWVFTTRPNPAEFSSARDDAARPSGPSLLTCLHRHHSLLLVTLSYAALGYFQYLFFYWVQFYFKDVLKVPVEESRWYAMAPNLAMAAGMMMGGGLADRLSIAFGNRIGQGTVVAGGLMASGVFAMAGAKFHDPMIAVVFFSLAMGSLGMCEGPFWTSAVQMGGRQGGLSGAIFNTGGNIGGMLAPVVTPIFADRYGWENSIGLACIFCFIGSVLWVGIDPKPLPELEERNGGIEEAIDDGERLS